MSAGFTLTNPGERAIEVDRIETSCDCVAVVPQPFQVPSKGGVPVQVIFDSSGQPEFLGKLRIDVVGYGRLDQMLFRSYVYVEVDRKGAGIP